MIFECSSAIYTLALNLLWEFSNSQTSYWEKTKIKHAKKEWNQNRFTNNMNIANFIRRAWIVCFRHWGLFVILFLQKANIKNEIYFTKKPNNYTHTLPVCSILSSFVTSTASVPLSSIFGVFSSMWIAKKVTKWFEKNTNGIFPKQNSPTDSNLICGFVFTHAHKKNTKKIELKIYKKNVCSENPAFLPMISSLSTSSVTLVFVSISGDFCLSFVSPSTSSPSTVGGDPSFQN